MPVPASCAVSAPEGAQLAMALAVALRRSCTIARSPAPLDQLADELAVLSNTK